MHCFRCLRNTRVSCCKRKHAFLRTLKDSPSVTRIWNEMLGKPDIVAHDTYARRSKQRSGAIELFMIMKAKGSSPSWTI
ncbi:conserved hypothetical protein [Ricinus communis]|uniref:Pentatricopeptide repeat-containing protein n=1 Tax=Ricinus communis TaxID=3988 RepID=B9ST12_RICCO|nr:conserved hypothetical protein [Ricinus communis]